MEFIIIFVSCFTILTVTIIYIAVTLKKQKPSAEEVATMNKRKFEIREEFPTTTIQATVVDIQCRAELVGIKEPKAVEIFTIIFETADKSILKVNVPKDMYDGFEIGQHGKLTIIEGELYSFVI